MPKRIHYKKLFLIDGVGALLSTLMLGVVLVNFNDFFGMPKYILYYLAGIAGVFSIYSFTCFFRKIKKWRLYLIFIATANLLYGFLTLGLVIYLNQKLTLFGKTYFVIELIVLLILVRMEFKTATYRIKKRRKKR
ncbi:hypothetical protein ABW636_02895 [Aquimarina sp. 2201CG1-2-11]|uniref:hypothetical protein n=1 Tax=Aquimarina discodermiae TaxID=3231043 RepID=UPI003461BAC6